MSENYHPVLYTPAGDTSCSSLLRLAALGAVVGGAAAGASNLRRQQCGALETGAMLAATARAAVAAGAATALAGAVAGTVAEQGMVRLGLMFATGVAVLYGIERWAEQRQEAADVRG